MSLIIYIFNLINYIKLTWLGFIYLSIYYFNLINYMELIWTSICIL